MSNHINLKQMPFKTGSSANTIHIKMQNQQLDGTTKDSKDVFSVQHTSEEEIHIPNLKSEDLLFKTAVRTEETIPSKLKEFAEKIMDKPDVYLLRPNTDKTTPDGVLVLEYFSEIQNMQERSLLLVGASGSGKSSLVNAIFNYVTAVSFDDDFRFTVMSGGKMHSIPHLAGKVICYKIHCQIGFKIGFNLNIIDVPGIQSGDNSSIYRQLIDLNQHVSHIDGICLVVPSFCRLTEDNRSIFNNILSIFGNDFSYVIPLITFDEGGDIKALDTLQALQIRYVENPCFRFDNSQLLNGNEHIEVWNRRQNTLNKMFGEPSVFMQISVRLMIKVLQSRAILHQSYLQATNLLQQLEELLQRAPVQNVHRIGDQTDIEIITNRQQMKFEDDRRKLENELKNNHALILEHGTVLKELAYLN